MFPKGWTRIRSMIARRDGPWIQFIAFGSAAGGQMYGLSCGCDFLWEPDVCGSSYLGFSIGSENMRYDPDIPVKRFREISRSCVPFVDQPLKAAEIERKLRNLISFYPSLFGWGDVKAHYPLCVVATVKGDRKTAKKHFELYKRAFLNPQFDWTITRVKELQHCLDLMTCHEELKKYLKGVEDEKLKGYKGL